MRDLALQGRAAPQTCFGAPVVQGRDVSSGNPRGRITRAQAIPATEAPD